jgi:alanine dehydrogenase
MSTEPPANDTLTRLRQSIALAGERPKKRVVELVVGNDREIGRIPELKGKGGSTPERRVGIIPEQVAGLRDLFHSLGLRLRVSVVEKAGARAGYSDSDFVHAGAEVLGFDELAWREGPPDVFHALKEPSLYEAQLPGPFCRIGALHVGDPHKDGGFARLMEKGNVTVFDGSRIGGKGRNPIRASMSVFAGEIAAEWTIDHLAARGLGGHAVVVGGGNAGKACTRKLLAADPITRVTIAEDGVEPKRVDEVARGFMGDSRVDVVPIAGVDDPTLLKMLRGAHAVVFAVAGQAHRAPRVVTASALQVLNPAAMIIDISIDEGGAIDRGPRDDWPSEKLIPHFEQELRPRYYRAEPNMPRVYSPEASRFHGEAILPYLATLLWLAAREGGAEGLTKHLRTVAVDGHGSDPLRVAEPRMLAAFVQDLRNGMVDGRHIARFVQTRPFEGTAE